MLLFLPAALAKAPRVEVPSEGAVLALLRGPTTDGRPAVAVTVGSAPVVAVLDVAGRRNRVSPAAATALGVDAGVLDELHLGPVVARGVPVEIDPQADGLVLGTRSLSLAVALVASEGTVHLADEAHADALLATVGAAVRATDDGVSLEVAGALRWGEALDERVFALRTDLPASRIGPSPELPEAVIRGGERWHDVGTQLGAVALPDTWIREDAALGTPDLGYDVLYALDLAVAPDGRVAFRAAPEPRWTDATPATVAAAKARYDREEERAKGTADATTAPSAARVQIGFDGPAASAPTGPANPVVRDRNLDLAETLWRAGDVDEALPRYLSASRRAGDDCRAYELLGERRLASSGTSVRQDRVGKLVSDPLRRAAELGGCAHAAGLLAAVERARGAPVNVTGGSDGDEANRHVAAALQGDPARVVAELRELPGSSTNHPLTAALGALAAAKQANVASEAARRMYRADERWLPGVLVRAVVKGQPPPAWDALSEARTPGSPLLACQHAVLDALSGDVAGARTLLDARRWTTVADWWAASVVVARLAGDAAAADDALAELRLRFPLIPSSDLGFPAPPPPTPASHRR